MANISIKLKSNIDDLLELDEESGARHTDYISPSVNVLVNLGKVIKVNYVSKSDITATPTADLPEEAIESLKYLVESTLVFALPTEELIHHSWIESVNGQAILPSIDMSSAYIKLTDDYLLDTKSKTVINKSTVKICTECGKPLDVAHKTLCSACLTKKYFHVQNYSYAPSFVMHGTQSGTHAKSNPIWYGLELEYGLESKLPMATLISDHSTELYLKSDSSIRGGSFQAEMVSHPCSFKHLMSPTSWVSKLDTLDAVNNPESNGCHIHISRTAFKDDKHYAKFKFLIQENIELLELIGGRKLNQYCNITANKATMFKAMKEGTGGEKYALCNEQHKNTIELRFMASSNKSTQVKRYLQYIDSMIKYTAYYGSTASYDGYYKYVTKYEATYPYICKLLSANESLLTGSIQYKAPTMLTCDILDLPARYYGIVTQLEFSNTSGMDNGTVVRVDNSTFRIETDVNTGNIKSVYGYNIQPTSKVIATYAKI